MVVSIFEYVAKSSDVPLCRCEDPLRDSDVAEVFIFLDNGKAGVVVTLLDVTNVSKGRRENIDAMTAPRSKQQCAISEEIRRDVCGRV